MTERLPPKKYPENNTLPPNPERATQDVSEEDLEIKKEKVRQEKFNTIENNLMLTIQGFDELNKKMGRPPFTDEELRNIPSVAHSLALLNEMQQTAVPVPQVESTLPKEDAGRARRESMFTSRSPDIYKTQPKKETPLVKVNPEENINQSPVTSPEELAAVTILEKKIQEKLPALIKQKYYADNIIKLVKAIDAGEEISEERKWKFIDTTRKNMHNYVGLAHDVSFNIEAGKLSYDLNVSESESLSSIKEKYTEYLSQLDTTTLVNGEQTKEARKKVTRILDLLNDAERTIHNEVRLQDIPKISQLAGELLKKRNENLFR